jgi:hypothetical protein
MTDWHLEYADEVEVFKLLAERHPDLGGGLVSFCFNDVSYQIGMTTRPPKGWGPLAAFRTLDHAERFAVRELLEFHSEEVCWDLCAVRGVVALCRGPIQVGPTFVDAGRGRDVAYDGLVRLYERAIQLPGGAESLVMVKSAMGARELPDGTTLHPRLTPLEVVGYWAGR